MKVRVRLFALAKQLAGQEDLELNLPEPVTVADVRHALQKQLPTLAAGGGQIRFAVNADFASDETVLQAGDELACIPPVSGG